MDDAKGGESGRGEVTRNAAAPSRPRIVCADDDAAMGALVVRILSERFEIMTVGSGHAALQAIGSSPPDLVLSDIMMPGLDGMELLRAIRGDPALHDIPVILISGSHDEEALVQCMDWGADDYLSKPFSARELLARVSAHVRLYRERRVAADKLRASEKRLQQADSAKDEFLAVLGHELRTPLAAISLWTGALKSGAVPAHELGRALDAIGASLQAQTRLIDDLLDLARIRTGKFHLELASAHVVELVRTAADVIKPLARAKSIQFDVQVADMGHALLDPNRFRQVLWNLLSNAIKFTPAGGTVRLCVEKANGFLELGVTDTGKGIAAEFMPHVFERFRQADTGDMRQHDGLGIGLAISKEVIELHGGTIAAYSAGPGLGSTFDVRIPCIDAPGPAIETARMTSQQDTPALKDLIVVVVEDDSSTLTATVETLAHEGARVLAATTGVEALKHLEALEGSRAPLVMLVDLQLPGMHGVDLLGQVAAARRPKGLQPPVACAISARARAEERQRALDVGFDMYLSKPVTPERLVEAMMDLRRVASELR